MTRPIWERYYMANRGLRPFRRPDDGYKVQFDGAHGFFSLVNSDGAYDSA